jgi:hypothetical protein
MSALPLLFSLPLWLPISKVRCWPMHGVLKIARLLRCSPSSLYHACTFVLVGRIPSSSFGEHRFAITAPSFSRANTGLWMQPTRQLVCSHVARVLIVVIPSKEPEAHQWQRHAVSLDFSANHEAWLAQNGQHEKRAVIGDIRAWGAELNCAPRLLDKSVEALPAYCLEANALSHIASFASLLEDVPTFGTGSIRHRPVRLEWMHDAKSKRFLRRPWLISSDHSRPISFSLSSISQIAFCHGCLG